MQGKLCDTLFCITYYYKDFYEQGQYNYFIFFYTMTEGFPYRYNLFEGQRF